MNPPYGKALGAWLNRLAMHGNGIALVFARTDTRAFFENVWGKASLLLFVRGRLTFARPDGSEPSLGHNSGGPSVLIGYGEEAARRLRLNSSLGVCVCCESGPERTVALRKLLEAKDAAVRARLNPGS